MRIPKISHLVVSGLLAVLSLLPLTAAAAPNWSLPIALGSGSTKPAVAVDAGGQQHFVWWEPSKRIIQYASCTGADGSNCTAAIDLPSKGTSYYPNLAIDPQGRPNVVFETKYGGSYQVFWTRKETSGWSTPVKVSNQPYSELPAIAIGSDGVIHVIYQSKQDNTGYVYYTKNKSGKWRRAKALTQVQSSQPLSTFANLAEEESNHREAKLISNGFFPHIALDGSNRAHVVWNAPSPYGIRYRYQTGGKKWSRIITVANGQKEQTPDIAVAPNGAVGIIWGTYDDFNAAFAEYRNGNLDNYANDIDGGLAQSLWPRIAADCASTFHFVFQGKPSPNYSWNVYYRSYDSATNVFGDRTVISQLGAQEQTPAIAVGSIAAMVWANTSYATTYASVAATGCP